MLKLDFAHMLVENRQLFMIAADMVDTVSENNPLRLAFLVLNKVRYDKIPVLELDSKLQGHFTRLLITDTMLGLDHNCFTSLDTMTVKDVMTTDVATINDPYDLETVLHLLVDNPFIPVVLDGVFTGIVTRREVMKGIQHIGQHIEQQFTLEPDSPVTEKETVLIKTRQDNECVLVFLLTTGIPIAFRFNSKDSCTNPQLETEQNSTYSSQQSQCWHIRRHPCLQLNDHRRGEHANNRSINLHLQMF